MIPWLEARELELGHWGTEIVPLGLAVAEK